MLLLLPALVVAQFSFVGLWVSQLLPELRQSKRERERGREECTANKWKREKREGEKRKRKTEADWDNYKQLEMNCLEMAILETMQTKLKLRLPNCVYSVCVCVLCVGVGFTVSLFVFFPNFGQDKVKGYV